MTDSILSLADHASRQNWQWMFVATLILVILAMTLVARWFVADRKSVADRLTAITDRHIEQGAKLVEVVALNNELVKNNTAVMTKVQEVMVLCQARQVLANGPR